MAISKVRSVRYQSILDVISIAAFVSISSLLCDACSVPPKGCTKDKCLSLRNRPTSTDPRMGYYFGQLSSGANRSLINQAGGPYVNYEAFTEVGKIIRGTPSKTLSDCCFDCAKTDGCWLYQFFDKPALSGKKQVNNFYPGVQCYLLSGGSDFTSNKVFGAPFSGDKTLQLTNKLLYDASWVGGLCNGNASVVDDPHFVGAMGTHFDFNGQLDKSFCLATDSRLHVNMLLRGYEDSRSSVGATKMNNGKALRSWIKEVGILWTDDEGVEHHAHLIARDGKQQARGSGFLARMLVDGVNFEANLPRGAGEAVFAPGGFQLTLVRTEKKGPYDVDLFSLKIGEVAEIDMRMRVAHAALQAPNDAEAHFNLHFHKIEATSAVHGVLGQTYRTTASQMIKALEYGLLTKLMRTSVVADGESGKGFLEGEVSDYITSDVLAPDCKFSSFVSSQHKIVTS